MWQSKYRAKKVSTEDGIFDSQKECKRWIELKRMAEQGEIQDLRRQVPYELIPAQKDNGKTIERAVTYKADFVYKYKGSLVVEDVKGFKTAEYIIKRKLMLYRHSIRIKEV